LYFKRKRIVRLGFSGFYDSSAFVGVLAVFKACGGFVGAFPFSSAAWTRCFVFVTPDFKIAAANVAFDVCWFGLK
jgi:hypothetical protein